MKECDKRTSHICSELHMVCISCNNVRHPVTKTFTPLHSTSLRYNEDSNFPRTHRKNWVMKLQRANGRTDSQL